MTNLGFYCLDHKDSLCNYLLLAKEQKQKRLLCDECLYNEEKKEWKPDFLDVMPLTLVLNFPELLIDKLLNDQRSKYLEFFFKLCDSNLENEFTQEIAKFEALEYMYGQIKDKIKLQLKEYQDFQEQLKKQRLQFLENIKFPQFVQLISQLNSGEKQKQSDQNVQTYFLLSSLVDEMIKDNGILISSQINEMIANQKKMKINISKITGDYYESQLATLFKQHDEFITKLNSQYNPPMIFEGMQFKLLSNDFQSQLWLKFRGSGKTVKQMSLVYLGSRDGLNGNSFWAKVNNKSNMLMVFKSKNGNSDYIYGAYSPCLWLQTKNNYVPDETLTSFIFSQTYNQIYPIKKEHKAYAIYSHQSYGPYFGGGHDVSIGADFTIGGCSGLGHTYSTEKYKQSLQPLFGGAQPNIAECEIYEIIFQ